ncbi:MAG: C4-type zinc ribbon domain-containing protein [Anaerolineaceae bacterium]
MNQAPHLYKLQQLDNEIDRSEIRLNAIARIIASDKEIVDATRLFDEAKGETRQAEHGLREKEEAVKEIRIKIATSEQSLYGGKIRNPKELQDLQTEIASLKKRLSIAEDAQLEQMILLEACEAQTKLADEHLKEVRNSKASELSLLLGEQDTLQKKLERLHKERPATTGSIASEALQKYESIRLAKKGRAVVAIVDDSCEGCGAAIRPAERQAARSSNQLVFCDTCGRIIYAE